MSPRWRELSPEQAAAAAMVVEAKARGLALTGPDGLLKYPGVARAGPDDGKCAVARGRGHGLQPRCGGEVTGELVRLIQTAESRWCVDPDETDGRLGASDGRCAGVDPGPPTAIQGPAGT